MAESRRYALDAQLDIEQILLEAQQRWLRPAEICEILQNHKIFRIAPESPNRPPSGSLFLFDRKVLRYFRKDGHNWRKKKDGKTVKEAHERLKAGSVDVLHCYYAHGEDNENFQRRSYWMLEEELSHIVLVHYREVQGNRTYNRIKDANVTPNNSRQNEDVSNSNIYSSAASRFRQYDHQGASHVTDTSLNSTQASEYEDAESVYRHQVSPQFQSFHETQSPILQQTDVVSSSCHPVPISNNYQGQHPAIPDTSFGPKSDIPTNIDLTYELQRGLEFSTWGNVVERSNAGYPSINFLPSHPSTQSSGLNIGPGEDNEPLDQAVTGLPRKQQELESHSGGLKEWKASGSDSLHESKWSSIDHSSLTQPLMTDLTHKSIDANRVEQCDTTVLPNTYLTELSGQHTTLNRHPLLGGVMQEGLRKLDSFDRWMSRELGDVSESTLQPGSGAYWEGVGSEGGDDSGISNQVALDNYVLSPSLSQDQLFSIIDFTPISAFAGSEIMVVISGRFLMNQDEVEKHSWACMFGEIEVPVQIVGDGILRCQTPSHETGRVPFYITCSNRLACSEVREFEFHASSETLLHVRFEKLLTLTTKGSIQSSSQLCIKISALLKDEKQDEFFSSDKEKHLKEKLHAWLLQKVGEDGKGPCVLDEGGQGVVHFSAALGYNWALPPILAAGVGVDFRDANGWTALHWAAYYGRERTVGFLISLGAAPGVVVDPTSAYPCGRTPSDLAAANGHKGIAGYLAESSLSSQLSTLDVKDSSSPHYGREKSIETVSMRDASDDLTLKDSLAAVRNATQAAARIHQVLRYKSFQRKQVEEYGGSEFGISDERAVSLIAGKGKKGGRNDEPVHAAATRIQNKFRSYKGRKEFLLIRKRIIKIQAHVRGHQVRKNYKKIIWSVGMLDRIILKWRRKGRGLSRVKQQEAGSSSSMVDEETKEDDYDFLKDGRKQTEERLQKALARVKSMVKYPDAQDQYSRLLNVVSEMQETKAMYDKVLNSAEADFDDDLIDFESLLDDDDTLMPTAS